MRRKNAFAILIIVSGLLQSVFFCGNTIGQQQAKPRKKKFGFSLTEKQSKSPPQAKGPKPASNTNQSEGDVQLHTTMAVLDVLITDKDGHFINSIGEIKKEDLIVREDGVEQQVGTFARGDSIEIPKSIILIIDYSGSQFHYLDSSLDAAHTLVTQLGPSDQMAIVTDDVELLCDYTNDKAKLTKALSSIKTKRLNENAGKSLQFSALTAALRELIDADHVRPYIIFQTDGDEIFKLTDQQELRKEYFHDFPYSMMSKIAFKGLIQTIERTPGTIYTIVPGEAWIANDPDERKALGRKLFDQTIEGRLKAGRNRKDINDAAVMQMVGRTQSGQLAASMVARITGGWTSFLRNPEDAAEIYARILLNINNRYIIGYYPKNTANDGKKREVRVEVRGHPEYIVLGRISYYPQIGND